MSAPDTGIVDYSLLCKQLDALAEEDSFWLSLLSNASALIYETLPDINWVGFYLTKAHEGADMLVLGPFQGKVACTRIGWGAGVCGTAAQSRATQLVVDVHEFPGHIACDATSASELVVPIIVDERVVGVLDIDSPRKGRFSDEDAQGLEAFVRTLVRHTRFPQL